MPAVLLLSFLLTVFFTVDVWAASGRKAMVATADPRASQAAVEVLRQGGNAVDAAVAAQWVLNVVEPHSSGIGGGGFFLFYEAATGRVYSFDGRETAPQGAFPEMFLTEEGEPYSFWPERISGGLPAGVPGILKLLETVHQRFGSGHFSFGELFEPAIGFAENGFVISEKLASFIDSEQDRLRLFPASAAIFLAPDGTPKRAGETLHQTDLAKTFRLIARQGSRSFYEGDIARDIVRAVQEAPFHPGTMTLEDLASYRVLQREPVRGRYRGYQVFGMGPPSSGGTTVLQTLQMLNFFDMAELDEADRISAFAQAQALAFYDRNRFLADPDHAEVPVAWLLSGERVHELAKRVRPEGPAAIQARHVPPDGMQTSHISIADEDGNLVAFTTTIEHMFGSAMVVPGRGFLLNNELTDFDTRPYREDGSLAANAPAPGKRPRSSMSPTLVFYDGQPVLVAGSPGGSRIIGVVLNILTRIIDEGMSVDKAVSAPRVINRGDETELEAPYWKFPELVEELEKRGLRPVQAGPAGNAQVIVIHQYGRLTGASDPRGEGKAIGY